jgi:hypothetical protein
MFGQAAAQFADRITAPFDEDDPRDMLVAGAKRFVEFCTSDAARYQLLFQRTIPGFEPSAESYSHAVRALESSRQRLVAAGIDDPRHVDLWTAMMTGLVDQQISNDPGGTRWTSLVEDAVDALIAYGRARQPKRTSTRTNKRTTKGGGRGDQG